MRHKYKFDLDYLIVSVAIIVFAGSATLLIKSDLILDNKNIVSNNEQIALLDEINNDIRTKYSNEIDWVPVSNNTELFNEQMVFSGGDSSAQIEFKKGERFNLAPNSMILISQSKSGQATLDLKEGNLSGSLTENIYLKLGDKKIKAQEGTTSKILVSKNKDLSVIQVKQGSLEVEDKKGIKQKIDKDTEAIIGAKKVSQRKILHRFISPNNNEKVWFKNGQLIKIQWDTLDKNKDIIEFSKFSDFKESKQFEVLNKPFQIDVNKLTCKHCYWRIIRKDQNDKISYNSISQTFELTQNTPPLIISPKNNSIVTLDINKNTKTKIMLSWKKQKYIKGYELQISDNFNNVTKSKVIKSFSNELLYELENKGYFWRIRSFRNDSKYTPWSEISSFKIGNFDEVTTVSLSSPQDASTFTAIDFPYEVALNWLPVKLKGEYQVQVSNSRDFEKYKFKTFNTKNTNLKIKLNRAGTYFWKVRFIGKDKAYFPTSETFSLEIKEYKKLPAIDIQIDELNFEVNRRKKTLQYYFDLIFGQLISKAYAQESKPFDINWKKVEGASSYQVELAKDKEFSNILLSKKVSNSYFSIKNITPGSYYFRVRAIDINNVLGSPSNPVPLKIKFKNINSLIKERIKVKKANSNGITIQTIKWSASKYCSNYKIDILRKNNDVIKSVKSKRNILKDEFPVNTFLKWKVACLNNKSKIINESKSFNLYFKYPRQYDPPSLVSPSKNFINVFQNEDFSVDFKWNPVEGATGYRLVIFKDNEIDNPIYDQNVEETFATVKFDKEIEGKLNWRLQTVSEESFSRPSQSNSFNIIKRNIVSINYLTPKENLITTTARKQNVKFSWQDEGSKYLFIISKDSDFDNALFKKVISKPFISFKLPQNNYYWKVIPLVKDEFTDKKFFELNNESQSNFLEVHRVEKRFYQVSLGGGYIESEQEVSSLNSDILKGQGQFPLIDFDLVLADYPILKRLGWLARINYKTSQAPIESNTQAETANGNFLDYEFQGTMNLFRFSQYHFYAHFGYYSHRLINTSSISGQTKLLSIEMPFASAGVNIFKRFNNFILEFHSDTLIDTKGSNSNGFRYSMLGLYDFKNFGIGLNLAALQINAPSNAIGSDDDNDKISHSQFNVSLLFRNRF